MPQTKEDLLSMEDFTESSLLDQIKEEEEEESLTEEETLAKEAKEKEEAEEIEAKKLEEKEEEEKQRLAKEQEDLLTDEEKEAKAKVEAEKKASEEAEGSFWEDVEAITGNTYEVEYGEVKPDSPEGAALREKVVADTAIAENLDHIKEKFPEAYQVLEHVSNGGKFTDLMTKNGQDYSSITLTEENKIQQKIVLKDYYLSKGLSEAKAIRNVEDDEDSEEGLFKNAEAALKEQQTEEANNKEGILQKQSMLKEAQDSRDKQFGQVLSTMINAGQVGNFKVPKADAESFYDHIMKNVKREGEGYAITIPLTNENLNSSLEQMLFGFRKGDLSKYVATAATTIKAKTLKRNLRKEKGAEEGSSEDKLRIQGKKLPTMGAFEV